MSKLKKIKITVECEGQETQVLEGNTVLISIADCPDWSTADPTIEIRPQCVIQGEYLGLCRLVTHQASHVSWYYHERTAEAKEKLEEMKRKAEEEESAVHLVKTKGRTKK